MIRTADFKVSSSAYLSVIARATIARLWWLAIAPAALTAYGAVADWRWAVVALMLTFIVYPMAMSLTILRYATLPQLAMRASATVAEIDGKSITLYKREHDDGRLTVVGNAAVTAVTVSEGTIRMHTGRHAEDIILIPAAAIAPNDLNDLLRISAPADTYDFSN